MIEERARGGIIISNLGTVSSDNDTLEHHGVKGQKWGVRKAPETTGNRGKRRMLTAIKNLREKKKANDPRNMSNQQLRSAIERQRLINDLRRAQGKMTSEEAFRRTMKIADFFGDTLKTAVGIAPKVVDAINSGFQTLSKAASLLKAPWETVTTIHSNTTRLKELRINTKNNIKKKDNNKGNNDNNRNNNKDKKDKKDKKDPRGTRVEAYIQ